MEEMHLIEHECNEAMSMLVDAGVEIPSWISDTATLDTP